MISSKYNSLNYLKYLNNCDLNYKYYLKSINETPAVDKIVFELPTNMLPSMEISEEDNQNKLLLKCFLAFYFINLKMPYINCNHFKDNNVVRGSNNSFHYAYLNTYNNLIEKYQLISLLFNENDRDNDSIQNLSKFDKKISLNNPNSNTLNFRLDVQALRIAEYKDILNTIFDRAELQKLKFKLNIVFKNFNNKINSMEELKMFLYIWNV
jgi:hypothetical protein